VVRFTTYSGDLKVHRDDPERSQANQWGIAAQWILLGVLAMFGIPALAMWWHLSWRSVRNVFLIAGPVSVAYMSALFISLDQTLWRNPDRRNLFDPAFSLLAVSFAATWLFFACRYLERKLGLTSLRKVHIGSISLLLIAGLIYYNLLPPLFLSLEEDWQKALVRIFLHPLIFETCYATTRLVALSVTELPPGASLAWPTMIVGLGSLFGRFLISSLGSTGATVGVSLALGFEEVLLRLSIQWRDRRVAKILGRFRRFRGCKGRGTAVEPHKATPRTALKREDYDNRRAILYSDLAAVDIVGEISSIVVSGVMLWLYAGVPFSRAALDTFMQLIIELFVDWCTVMIETSHGLLVVEAWSAKNHARNRVKGYLSPAVRWAIFVTLLMSIMSMYVSSELFKPGTGLWVPSL
jgi:hypothetical protein